MAINVRIVRAYSPPAGPYPIPCDEDHPPMTVIIEELDTGVQHQVFACHSIANASPCDVIDYVRDAGYTVPDADDECPPH